jgi:nucleoside-diphosphate-sugar epimerase
MMIDFTDSQKASKVFVLGATGFIGSAVTKRLVELGFTDLHCLCRDQIRKNQLCSDLDASCIDFLDGDVARHDLLREGVEEAKIVLNASGLASDWGVKEAFWEVNVDGPKAIVGMIEEGGASTQYIHITSASVYGFSDVEKTEASPLVVSDRFYTASKVEIHAWLREKMRQDHSFPITVLAPTIVWGSGDRAYVPGIREQLERGQMVYFRGADAVDFVYIDDLVDAILLCFFNERTYDQEYIINGPRRFTFEEYIQKIAEFSELTPPKRTVPIWLANGIAGVAEGMQRLGRSQDPDQRPVLSRLQVLLFTKAMKASIAKAKEDLGYDPQIGFKEGIGGLREYVQQLS